MDDTEAGRLRVCCGGWVEGVGGCVSKGWFEGEVDKHMNLTGMELGHLHLYNSVNTQQGIATERKSYNIHKHTHTYSNKGVRERSR